MGETARLEDCELCISAVVRERGISSNSFCFLNCWNVLKMEDSLDWKRIKMSIPEHIEIFPLSLIEALIKKMLRMNLPTGREDEVVDEQSGQLKTVCREKSRGRNDERAAQIQMTVQGRFRSERLLSLLSHILNIYE